MGNQQAATEAPVAHEDAERRANADGDSGCTAAERSARSPPRSRPSALMVRR